MKNIKLTLRLFLGYALYALGISLIIKANLGLAPWDVLHQGLATTFGVTFGQASIGVGILIVVLNVKLGEKVGLGTIGNMIFIGLFVDFMLESPLVPAFQTLPLKFFQSFAGMWVIGLASFVYLSCGMGSGPRDGMMVALTKITGKPIALIRNSIEITVLALGYLLGGSIGIGTVLTALGVGFAIQWTFRLFKYDVKAQKHEALDLSIFKIKQDA